MTWLAQRLEELGKNQAGLARALGIPQQRVREINKGLRRIQQKEWEPLARYLEWTVSDIHSALGDMQSGPIAIPTVRNVTVPHLSASKVMAFPLTDEAIPVWWNKHTGAGVLHIERRIVDAVPRSEYLRYAQFSFALEVMHDDMSPAFERRDILVINPDRGVAPGDDVLLVRGYEERATTPFDAVLRRLLKETESHWHVRQFNPGKDYKLDRLEWTRALHIAGKRSR